MSIATMVRLGAERHREQSVPLAKAASGNSATTKKTVDSAMEKIAAFIPSEVIGIYVAGFGIFSPESNSWKWWIFGICMGLIPVFMFLNYLAEKKNAKPGSPATLSLGINLTLFLFAAVAFLAWAAALPGTPFLSITKYATAIGGWSVVILALIMYRVADLMDVVPKLR